MIKRNPAVYSAPEIGVEALESLYPLAQSPSGLSVEDLNETPTSWD